jgi:glycosyltransferase involved in cell wall biosynthesis
MSQYPQVSILTPTYNRKQFIELCIFNLKNQTYPLDKLEWFVLDDSEIPYSKKELIHIRDSILPIKFKYSHDRVKQHIGTKRNKLVKNATYKTVIMMDDDDIYQPNYVKNSIDTMIEKNVKCVGSNQMIFYHQSKPDRRLTIIKCEAKRQIHEATLCFTKKYFNSMQGFKKNSQGEGVGLIDFNDKNVANIPIDDLMVCVAHKWQTLSKDPFYEYTNHVQPYTDSNVIKKHYDLLEIILSGEKD